jgi:hypothetical protein
MSDVPRTLRRAGGAFVSDEREAKLIGLAAAQLGLVTARQLDELGYSRTYVRARLASGAWQKMQRSVFKLSATDKTVAEREVAAILAFDGVLSHGSAARHHRVDFSRDWKVSLTIPHQRLVRGQTHGVDIYRSRDLPPEDIVTDGPFRYTSLGRTVLDQAAELKPHWLRATVDACLRQFPENLNRLWLTLLGHGLGRPGAAALRSLLSEYQPDSEIPDSVLESIAMELGLWTGRKPVLHYLVRGPDFEKSLDFVWPELELAIELDGFATHGTQDAFDRDRLTDRKLRALGWSIEHFTWRQVAYNRQHFFDEVRGLYDRLCAAAASAPA